MSVSVIVPIYNTEPYLRKCVDSILTQTYCDIECILVDDGSPDNSGKICDEYAQNDSRVRVIHKINGGLSDARNAGIDVATGEYLMFVDSDDYIMPETVEKLVNALAGNAAEISLCSFALVNEECCEIEETIGQSPIKDETLSGLQVISRYTEEGGWYYVVAVAKLYRKECFNNVRFPKGKIHEDEFVAHRLMGQCEKVVCISEKLYRYVQRDNSIMHNLSALSHLHAAEAFLERASYIDRFGMHDSAGVFFICAASRIAKYYGNDKKDSVVYRESIEAHRLFKNNIHLIKYCAPKDKIRAALICFSPALYQSMVAIYRQFRKTVGRS